MDTSVFSPKKKMKLSIFAVIATDFSGDMGGCQESRGGGGGGGGREVWEEGSKERDLE